MWKIEKFERISRKTVKINKQILTSLPDTESITSAVRGLLLAVASLATELGL